VATALVPTIEPATGADAASEVHGVELEAQPRCAIPTMSLTLLLRHTGRDMEVLVSETLPSKSRQR